VHWICQIEEKRVEKDRSNGYESDHVSEQDHCVYDVLHHVQIDTAVAVTSMKLRLREHKPARRFLQVKGQGQI